MEQAQFNYPERLWTDEEVMALSRNAILRALEGGNGHTEDKHFSLRNHAYRALLVKRM